MIVTVTPNPALDLTWHATEVRPGETHRVPAGRARAGGKGLNVARVLHTAGVPVRAVATVGGPTGDEFRAELEAAGVPATLVPVDASTRRSVAIVDEAAGEVSVFNEYGTAPTPAEAERLWASVPGEDAPPSAVAICGSLPPGMPADALVDVVRSLAADGIATLVDTSGPALLAAADAGATALKPNRDELLEATGATDVAAGARLLLDRGATLVVASLGADGLLAMHRDGRAVRARSPEIVHGNATGAGDAVAAAIALSLRDDPQLTEGGALETLARRCAAWGAAAVAMPLAGEIDPTISTRTDDVIVDDLQDTA